MNDLLREHAPVCEAAWRGIDAEATRTLKTLLAARRLVDFKGPLGWSAAAIGTGRTERLSAPLQEHVVARLPIFANIFLGNRRKIEVSCIKNIQ